MACEVWARVCVRLNIKYFIQYLQMRKNYQKWKQLQFFFSLFYFVFGGSREVGETYICLVCSSRLAVYTYSIECEARRRVGKHSDTCEYAIDML